MGSAPVFFWAGNAWIAGDGVLGDVDAVVSQATDPYADGLLVQRDQAAVRQVVEFAPQLQAGGIGSMPWMVDSTTTSWGSTGRDVFRVRMMYHRRDSRRTLAGSMFTGVVL